MRKFMMSMVAALAVVLSGMVVTPGVADDVVVGADQTVPVGGTGSFQVYLAATGSSDGDPLNNCNANTGSGNAVTLSFTTSNSAVLAKPADLTFTGCDDPSTDTVVENAQTVGFTISSNASVGAEVTLTATASGGRSTGNNPRIVGTFDPDSITITVAALNPCASVAAPAAPAISSLPVVADGEDEWFTTTPTVSATSAGATVTYSTDNATWGPTPPALGEGTTTVYAKAETFAGSTSCGVASSQRVFKVDTVAPTVSPASLADATWRGSSLSQTFTASDGTSGLAQSGDANFTLTASNESTRDSSGVVVPTFSSARTVYDAAGNSTTRSVSAWIDLSGPQVAPDDVTNTTWRKTSLSHDFTASDALSGLANAADAAFTLTASAESTLDSSGQVIPTTVSKTVQDAVGNSTTRQVSALIDLTNPEVSPGVNDTTWRNTPLSHDFTASDALSGLANAADAAFTLTASAQSILDSSGQVVPTTVSRSVSDTAGNQVSRSVSAQIDLTNPEVSSGVNDTTWRNGPLSHGFTASDALSGLANATDAAFTLTATGESTRDSSGQVVPSTARKTVSDRAGNSVTSSVSAWIDESGPQVVGPDVTNTTWRNTPLSHDFTASDALAGLANATDAAFTLTASAESTRDSWGELVPTTASKTVQDAVGNSTTRQVSALIDVTDPLVSPGVSNTTWRNTPLSHDFTASDALSGLANAADASFRLTAADESTRNSSGEVVPTQVSRTVSDQAGNPVTRSVLALIDTTAPTLTCPTAPTFTLGSTGTVTAGIVDSLSGPASPTASGSVDTSTIGQKTVTITGDDNAGNRGSANCTYDVDYKWSGFFQPIDVFNNDASVATVSDKTAWNSAKAGSAIPVKFSLSGNQGLNILAAGSPTTSPAKCPGWTANFDPIETLAGTTSGLKYDAIADQYNYTWKTSSALVGTCQRLEVKLVDGTSHYAFFKFTK